MSAAATISAGAPGSSASLRDLPWAGLCAVFFGAIISTLYGRITSFGLADVRGAIHAGFDEGAWITTASTVGQMLTGPLTVWLGITFGTRRVLMISVPIFTAATLALPFSPDLPTFLALQTVAGLASGTFIPLTIRFVLRNLPQRLWVYGIAIYAMNFELSMNVAASLEGWYIENWSWKWIFWQNAILGAAMLGCVVRGVPREPIDWPIFRRADWPGTIYASVGMSLLYAGLDQGNRLDWLDSGLVVGLLLGGSVLVALFFLHQLTTDQPALNMGFLARGNIPVLVLMFMCLRIVMLATSYVIPQYLTTVQGFRALQVGEVLMWIALPQFVLAPFVAALLRRVDPRYPLGLGLALVGVACWMGTHLTAYWATAQFLPAQIVQAVGQSFAMTSLVVFNIRNSNPAEALSFGAMFQATRLLGGEIGSAAMQTWIRVRHDYHGAVLGSAVVAGAAPTSAELHDYAAAVGGGSAETAETAARAAALLAQAVQQQAYVLAFIDGFVLVGAVVIACLSLMLLLRAAPRQM